MNLPTVLTTNMLKNNGNILLISCLIICLCFSACDNKPNEPSSQTESYSSSVLETTSSQIDEQTKEMLWSDYYSPEVLEELHKGKNEYIVSLKEDEIYDIHFYLPNKIEEYTDSESKTFDLYRLLDDYNWQKEDDCYYFDTDDMRVILRIQENSNKINKIFYEFVSIDNEEEYYYDFYGFLPTDNVVVNISNEQEQNYQVVGRNDLYVSFDESIVLNYIFSWISVRPQTNPLIYLRLGIHSSIYEYHDEFHVHIVNNVE